MLSLQRDTKIDSVLQSNKLDKEKTPPKTPEDPELAHLVPDLKAIGPAMNMQLSPEKLPTAADIGRLRPFPENNEQGLKRKFLERGTSQGPPEEGEHSATQAGEPLKRARDDSDGRVDNPRETKRPSPPPSPTRSSRVSKPSGFMAYASTASPFASVKGQSIFSNKSSPSVFATGTTTSQFPITSGLAPAFRSCTLTPTPIKLSGFEAFASSSSSPFASPAYKRQRSAFTNGNSSHSLERVATPTTGVFKDAERDSGDEEEGEEGGQPQSFSERLRAGRDDEYENTSDEARAKLTRLTEQNVMTGEEDEETIIQVRGKLFTLHGSSWKEKGTGILRLNIKKEDGTGARLVMRKDAVHTLLLNTTLFPGMHCSLAQDPRYLRFTAIDNGVATTYNLKMADAKLAEELLEEINANIPPSP